MTTTEALQYLIDNVRPFGYVKGPIYIDGCLIYRQSKTPQDLEKDIIAARANVAALERHRLALISLSDFIEGSEMNRVHLAYLFDYLDHPETEGYTSTRLRTTDAWARPSAVDILKEAEERADKITRWKEAETKILQLIMNPHDLAIPESVWKVMQYYRTPLAKCVYEASGNWPNSHGMWLTKGGWLSSESIKVNRWEPAEPKT